VPRNRQEVYILSKQRTPGGAASEMHNLFMCGFAGTAVSCGTVHLRQDIIKGATVPLLYNINEEGGKKMKTKRIVIGAMAAMMISTSICSFATANAADDTVQIIVGTTTAKAGGAYSLEVSLADIPSTGAQGVNFCLEFDKSVLSVESIDIGAIANTAALNADSTASTLPVFDTYIDNENGFISLIWSTSNKDASNWLQGSGVFCTINGKVAEGAADGKSDVKVAAVGRDTYSKSGVANTDIDCGYFKDGAQVSYKVATTDGYVEIGEAQTGKYLRGDANCDGEVTLNDAVAILQYVALASKYPLTEQGLINAECDGNDGITGGDALMVQKHDAGLVDLTNPEV